MIRAFDSVLRIVPNVPVDRLVAGLPKLGWLNRLKNSIRNFKDTCSRNGVLLVTRKSKRLDPGPRNTLRPRLQYRLRGAGAKAAGFRNPSSRWETEPDVKAAAAPSQSARPGEPGLPASPSWSKLLWLLTTENGDPDWIVVIPEASQPLQALVRPCASRPNGLGTARL